MIYNETVAYLSGPMSGYEEYNVPAFQQAAQRLRDIGLVVLSPAETANGVTHLPREWYMRHDFHLVEDADINIVMEGWTESEGAKAETIFAHEIGNPIYLYEAEGFPIGKQIHVTGLNVEYTLDTVRQAVNE